MNHASLFSGIGGFDLAAEWAGWTNIFNCDIEEFPRKVLKHHFPNTIQYADIKRTDFSVHRGTIDVLTGGFPCQPFSTAGKRLGKNDERHLWPEMFRAIREIRPRWVVGENVRGLLSWSDGLVLEEVYADLESEGYEVQAFVLPAAGINAPHKRDRVWIVAHNPNARTEGMRQQRQDAIHGLDIASNTKGGGGGGTSNENGRKVEGQDRNETEQFVIGSKVWPASNASGIGCGRRNERSEADQRAQWKVDQDERQHGNGVRSETTRRCTTPSDSDLQRGEERHIPTEPGEQIISDRSCDEHASNSNSLRSQPKGESARVEGSRLGFQGSCGHETTWENFPTQSPVCGGDDGLPKELDSITFSKWRKESIKAYGNAIVPQIAFRIFQTINQMEETWE